MQTEKSAELKAYAENIRKEVEKLSANTTEDAVKNSLAIANLLAVLYGDVMNVKPDMPEWPERDMFVLSKGKSAAALYAALALKGYFPVEWLETYNKGGSRLPFKPDRLKTPGIDMTTGFPGLGMSEALGIAFANAFKGRSNSTYCLVGEDEMNNGCVWEVLQSAPQKNMKNLTVILDKNGVQNDGASDSIAYVGNTLAKIKEFGWNVVECNGDDLEGIQDALALCKDAEKPSFVVLHTEN